MDTTGAGEDTQNAVDLMNDQHDALLDALEAKLKGDMLMHDMAMKQADVAREKYYKALEKIQKTNSGR